MDFLTITDTLKQIKLKKISVEELSKIFIQRIKDNLDINAFIYFDEENIINQLTGRINLLMAEFPTNTYPTLSVEEKSELDIGMVTFSPVLFSFLERTLLFKSI